ncbi:hypothetical protein GCM10010269_40660 [Streptomyces humidus]|uniref:Uncharacterized protein n=1 Tax=Streptomyces humidus TaxID=52259 RepID=A0A918L4Q5_9ACTN|nr:hypothetical protein GCM10010269_40660 [Streptomyces humidus]
MPECGAALRRLGAPAERGAGTREPLRTGGPPDAPAGLLQLTLPQEDKWDDSSARTACAVSPTRI